MAAVQVQKKEYASTTDSTSHSIVLDSSPTEDNLLIVFMTYDDTLSVAPSGYTLATSGADFVSGRCYYKIAGAGESATISMTMSGSGAVAMQAFEYSGMLTSGVLDQVAAVGTVGSGTTIVSATTPSTTQDNELVFVSAHMRMDVGTQTVTAWTNSFVIENEAITLGAVNEDMLLNVAAKTVSAIGTFQSTGSITTGGLGRDVALVATFNIAPELPIATTAWFRA